MAMTYDNATNILETHRFLISSSPQQWGEFLRTSCKFEAYNFNNQIMIAAQRINPTAVADYDHWNNVQECSVIKGRKGIALFNEYGKGLRYVFDAADVRECHDKGKNGHKPSLWTVEERHHDMIMRGLEERYGSLLLKKENLEDTIKEYVNQCVGEYILGNADLLAMSNEIHALMFSSAEFAILSRMGFAPKVEDYPAFEHIISYAMNREVIAAIGMVTQKVSFPFLREIGREIYAYDLSHVAELGMETVFEQRKDFADRFIETMDKNANLGLANASEGVHNAFDANGGEGANFEEVKDDARIDVHEGGRLSVSEHRSESATGGTDDQIRENESGIFEGTQGGTVSSDAGRWDIGGTLSGDSALSGSENGTADRTDDRGRGDFRSSEERGAHGVGSQDELHSRQSRRNRASGSSLRLEFTGEEPKYEQLSLFAPAEEEQIGTIMAKGSHSSSVLPEAFSLSMSQMQELLATGGGRTHSRERIWNQYSIGKSPEEISEFLKTEYETTGKGFQVDGHNISMWTDENGIYVGYGESAKETPIDIKIGAGREDIAHGFLSWTEAENLIRKTVREGEYLSAGEAFLTPQIVQKELADEIYYITESYQTTVLPQHHHYSDDMNKITELLSSKEGIASVCDALKDIIAKAESGELSQRLRSIYTLEGTLAKVEDFARERISLPAKEEVTVRAEDFITQDEIDYTLTRGSGFSHGSFRIYEHFLSEHDKKESVEFLKKEYGTGGRSHAFPGNDWGHEDHDAKGIRLEKGHYGNPYTNILLNWNTVEKRIRELIAADKYLSPEGKLQYQAYKQEQEQKALEKAKKELKPEVPMEEEVGEYAPIVLNDEEASFLGEKPIYGIWSYALKDTVRDENGAELSFASEEEAAEHISVLNNETNVDTFISKTQGNELSVGDIIRHKGSLWEVTEIGFQTNFSNVNPKEMASIFSHIGNIENFDGWEHVSNANRKVTLNLNGAEEMILLDKWELADISYTLAKNSENEIVVHAQREDVSVTERVADVRLSREEIQSIYAEKFSLARLIEEPINEAELSIEDITITCEWSESNVFEDGKTYSVYEFDKVMFDADSAKQERRAELIAQYGSDEEAIEADKENISAFTYDKTKFLVNFPDGKEPLVERQDIGDGDGGVIGFFRAFAEREKDENGKYHTIVKMLEEQREKDIRALGIESPTHSQEQKETVRIAGFLCDKVDEWETDAVTGEDAAFVIGYDKETETYFAKAEQNVFQFPVCPTREEVQDRYFNALGETERDRNEQNLRQSRGISDEDIKEYLERKTAINNRYENDFSVDLETTVNHLHELRDECLINFNLSESEFDVLVFDYIARHKEQEQEPTVPEETQTAAPSMTKASNFRITDDALGVGGAKAKFERNILAIETLKKIEEENRDASPDEQIILSNYVGWGGLSDAFDENKENWSKEYAKLKELLTPEEYSAARRSTLDSFYTSPTIIRAIYSKLSDMGFEKGNVLEPACGVGNFFGMIPEQMQKDSRLYGVELDSLSGRIAQKLYPDANIQIAGYENTSFSADFFDVAIGNVPFGEIKPYDKAYAKENFLIHDYFFAKTLDKVRAGGVIAFVTSKGTLDKQSEEVRRYIAERAEFLGAVRLPDTAFKANAGTDVTSDIIFLKKRDLPIVLSNNNMPEWISLATDEKGISMNRYFAEHPEQICGSMEMVSGPFGPVSTCKENPEKSLSEQLESAMGNIHGKIDKSFVMKQTEHQEANVLPADDSVRNFSFTVIEDKVYYRRNSIMEEVEGKPDTLSRIKDMCAIRDAVQDVLNVQLENTNNDELFREKQVRLNQLYDGFEKKYGRIASRTNKKAFENDTSYCLLKSLEKFDEDGNFKEKAAIFSKRTVKPIIQIESCDNSMDALFASLSEKATIDFDYMSSLCGRTREEMISELMGVIYKNPETEEYETAEEYLSGNVRRKLELARGFVEQGQTEYAVNVESLEKVQPEELKASDIAIRLGATWIEPEYINQFMKETFEMPERLFRKQYYWMTDSLSECGVTMNPYTSEWTLRGKSAYHNAIIDSTYGFARRNALQILEDSLNLKTSQVYDIVEDPVTGKEQRKLNEKETIIVQQKQELLKEKFNDWIFADPERREHLVTKYNQMFNCTRPRTYDGSHLTFKGIANGITLKDHQKDAIARVLYGGNSLLAHGVGAGKTYEMVAAAMESKRLGLCNKSLFVVPNHLTEQWGASFMKLYPNANILVATKKDFEPANRKEFCSRIATGDYDAVIIGHSQFERIPLSQEQISLSMENQIADIQMCIDSAKEAEGKKSPTVKQLERQKQSLERKLLELNDAPKDDVVTFEQLGVDRLFVDESHEFKNLFTYTKMRNVAGVSTTEAKKSTDLYQKCQYMDKLTGGKGVIFATGTPISNSLTELFTLMRYLQSDKLREMNLQNFDAWASTFAETQTAMELAPEGNNYRSKTRLAKFFNLPELMNVFKEVADIKTSDSLDLDVPDVVYEDVVTEQSEYQKDVSKTFGDRADIVRSGGVDRTIDNMLKITTDGRKLALDQRLINPMLPDEPGSKINEFIEKAYEIWENTKEDKLTQVVFCDLSTPPSKDGRFNIYDDAKKKLIEKGVPADEIAFIHDADTETKKANLFSKVRKGDVRFIFGSTAKLGAGTNIQHKLVALHHLDVPWRPSDIEQQEGRIIRQHNQNEKVKIFRYITVDSFDAYSWQLIENKQKFISQIMTSKSPVRMADNIDEQSLSYAELKALSTGNPLIKEKMDLEVQVNKLKMLKSAHQSSVFQMQDNITKILPQRIARNEEVIADLKEDMALYAEKKAEMAVVQPDLGMEGMEEIGGKEPFLMKVCGKEYFSRGEAGEAIIMACRDIKTPNTPFEIGEFCGFQLNVTFDALNQKFVAGLKGKRNYAVELDTSPIGNSIRLKNVLDNLGKELDAAQKRLSDAKSELETAKNEVEKPFPKEAEYQEKMLRLLEVNRLLENPENSSEERLAISQLVQNIDYVVGSYLNQMSDYDDPPLSREELLEMCKDEIFDIMNDGVSCRHEKGICDNLRSLGDALIEEKILEHGKDVLDPEEKKLSLSSMKGSLEQKKALESSMTTHTKANNKEEVL